MPQIFHRSTNTISRVSLVLVFLIVGGVFFAAEEVQRSPFASLRSVFREQPVPFSHQHHVAGLGIDCRYCHTSVESSSFAGIPPTKTCMNCHAQIWTNAPMLEPVRESFRSGQPIPWQRVHNLPDFVYFEHSIHVNKGVGCATCHGPVDQMPLTYAHATLQMEWCLDCHRAPEKYLRPQSEVFNMAYLPPTTSAPRQIDGQAFTNQPELGRYLIKKYKLHGTMFMTSCSTCHR